MTLYTVQANDPVETDFYHKKKRKRQNANLPTIPVPHKFPEPVTHVHTQYLLYPAPLISA
jgi:hypothetical protein